MADTLTDKYQPQAIESKWRQYWHDIELQKADLEKNADKDKYYTLVMFPYPSGEGLHAGHWRPYVISDVWTRYQIMQGKDVLFPMGWDAFGLPAENRAIKQGIHPQESTNQASMNMKRQLLETGALFDWDRELDTSKPDYYRWTQWIFAQFYKKGLAYRKEAMVNWCPKDQTVLANEQVVNGLCERCDTPVTKKSLRQWFFKITDYAEELLDFSGIQWADRVKTMQKNWIGKSQGVEIDFSLPDSEEKLAVFTKYPETIYGVTYMVIAPEHPWVERFTTEDNMQVVADYIKQTKAQTEISRLSTEKTKTGVFTGSYCVNPVNGEKIPIWIADYVLMNFGTGAVMGVPAHDARDFLFAKQYQLPIVRVVGKTSEDNSPVTTLEDVIEDGIIINSGELNGMVAHEKAAQATMDWLEQKAYGRRATTYRLRDWLVSRQRYWGAPIPIVYCDDCGEVLIPDNQLPVKLPYTTDFQPGGESPLARSSDFVNTVCPNCGKPAKRETDTMDTFVDSSWYFLRFTDPKNVDRIFDPEKVNAWMPVDLYIGGIEHAILHLLYARFFTKALADCGLFEFREPFTQLLDNGMIFLNGKKMSKSKGNIVNPDDIVAQYGTDTLRGYEMFIGPVNDDAEWNQNGMAGVYRFMNRIWGQLTAESSTEMTLSAPTHRLIKKVTEDLNDFGFNTVVSGLMEYSNKYGDMMTKADKLAVAQLMAPIFPHVAEEIWHRLGNGDSVFRSAWPTYDPKAFESEDRTVVFQVNGKTKGIVTVSASATQQEVEAAIQGDQRLGAHYPQTAKKVVFISGRLINFVLE